MHSSCGKITSLLLDVWPIAEHRIHRIGCGLSPRTRRMRAGVCAKSPNRLDYFVIQNSGTKILRTDNFVFVLLSFSQLIVAADTPPVLTLSRHLACKLLISFFFLWILVYLVSAIINTQQYTVLYVLGKCLNLKLVLHKKKHKAGCGLRKQKYFLLCLL